MGGLAELGGEKGKNKLLLCFIVLRNRRHGAICYCSIIYTFQETESWVIETA